MAVLRDEFRLEVRARADVTARAGFLAGDDCRRIEEWREAVSDPDARAIFLARGGYGAMRLLPAIDAGRLAAAPKWVVGFSDATALHGALNLAGLVTLHGPTVSTLPRAPAAVRAHLASLLFSGPSAVPGCHGTGVITPGRATGPLVGGCLALLAHLCGTPWFPRVRGGVLFFEDVNEKPYQLDRYLTQLRLSGALEGIRAVCVGQLIACDENGLSGAETVRAFVRSLGVPAIEGLAAGHVDDNHALPLGATVTVVAPAPGEPGSPRLLFDGDARA
jgi:muramoyltetrapeptide carboxypeptidase